MATGCCATRDCPWFEFSGRHGHGGGNCAQVAIRLEANFGGVHRDDQAEARMQRLVRELTVSNPDLPRHCHCRLLKSDVRNAASLPGGRLYITCGFYEVLADDEHLAAVLAHELAHIAADDHHRGRCKDREQALQREILADCAGVELLEQAGYRREAMSEVIAMISDVQPKSWTMRRQARVAQTVAFAE